MCENYYRILDSVEEPKGQILSSNKKSTFRHEVFAYRFLSHDIYILAKKTGLQILNAVRVAENVPAFLDDLNVFFKSKERQYDLQQMLISDPVQFISGDDLYAFAYSYIAHVNETGLFYDWGSNHYLWEFIWETIRNNEYPDKLPRVESLLLFDNKQNANDFMNQQRDLNYILAKVNLLEGVTESYDMNWFSEVPSNIPLSEVEQYARNYWEQKQTENPVTEVLFQGKYTWEEV